LAADDDQRRLIEELLRDGKVYQAEAALDQYLTETPQAATPLLILYAEIAQTRDDWPAALRRWRLALESDPRDIDALLGLVDALLHDRAFDEADALLMAALPHFPGDPSVGRMLAACSGQRDRHEEALARWRDVQERFPDDIWSVNGLVRALTNLGSFDAARELVNAYLPAHGGNRGLREAQGNLASRTGDWPAALRFWQELMDAYPEDGRLYNNLMAAQLGAQLAALGTAEADPAADNALGRAAAPKQERLFEIVSAFESLGSNCDFGQLQRYFGAEPLGLLRWAGTEPEEIIAAARAKFAGVGEPENTVIEVWDNGEYCVSDRRFNMLMHSFTFETVVDRETFTTQQIKRGRYLRRKLIEDLEGAEKLFVYKSPDMSEAEAHELFAALREIGPVWLLAVRAADDGHAPGTVQAAGDGLLFGYTDQFGFPGTPSPATVAVWTAICERAYALWRAAVSPQ